jgi:hypothetical protein
VGSETGGTGRGFEKITGLFKIMIVTVFAIFYRNNIVRK